MSRFDSIGSLDFIFEEDDSLSLLVSYNYYLGDPGQISGPPERCYPPEPDEIEITGIAIDLNKLEDEMREKIEEALLAGPIKAELERRYEPDDDFDDTDLF